MKAFTEGYQATLKNRRSLNSYQKHCACGNYEKFEKGKAKALSELGPCPVCKDGGGQNGGSCPACGISSPTS